MRSRPPANVYGVRVWIGVVLVVAAVLAAGAARCGADEPARPAETRALPPRAVPPPAQPPERRRRSRAPIRWRESVAVGSPADGRLVRGVRLPAQRPGFFTWDPVRRRSPNRHWRRYGTDRLVRVLLDVVREHRAAHPRAPRVGIGDLSRPRGGDFGVRFGPIGHASHQNGLDADVYYPRADRRERAPRTAAQIDRRLSQDLVDRFVAKGAQVVFVGPSTGLTGPRVQVLANHDNHLHVRLPAR
jgi:murein endopeptidase